MTVRRERSAGKAGRTRRRYGGEGAGNDGPDERWMASYLDMVTVLMCLFIVLFAMSTVDQEKYEELRASLQNGFGIEESDDPDAIPVTTVIPETVEDDEEALRAAAERELHDLIALRDRISADLTRHGIAENVRFDIDSRGLTIRLVGAETFFDGNSAALRPLARDVLGVIAPAISGIPNQVSIEGHAEPEGDSGPYATDWELSADRSTKVLRHMVERLSIAATRVSSIGYGSARPVETDGAADRSLNRRVDIVVLSDESEEVRNLIPALLD
ncbi:flagellar motor protein MotB [Ruicaihuangia caeni]|uniref:flagellar motor protein MotB n=1 Tax=Ruicaihuangia caeni TaxID=3042517 RepID=UPI00338F206E